MKLNEKSFIAILYLHSEENDVVDAP